MLSRNLKTVRHVRNCSKYFLTLKILYSVHRFPFPDSIHFTKGGSWRKTPKYWTTCKSHRSCTLYRIFLYILFSYHSHVSILFSQYLPSNSTNSFLSKIGKCYIKNGQIALFILIFLEKVSFSSLSTFILIFFKLLKSVKQKYTSTGQRLEFPRTSLNWTSFNITWFSS